jgi:tetratricopeptide (TPR) repeat protein
MKLRVTVAMFCLCFATSFGQTSAVEKYDAELKANPNASLARFRIAEIEFQHCNYQGAANGFAKALAGDLQPKWTEVWSRIYLGKIFDATGQRERAVREYTMAQQTNDDTRGALEEAAIYLAYPYPGKMEPVQ